MPRRRFDEEIEQGIAISYLCNVGPGNAKFDRIWNIKESTINQTLLSPGSKRACKNPLVTLYKGRNKAANAVHLYLSEMGQMDGLDNPDLVDSARYQRPIRLVRNEVFTPRELKLIEDMGLYFMFDRQLTPYEKLVGAVIELSRKDGEFQAEAIMQPIIFDKLREFYTSLKDRGTIPPRVRGVPQSPDDLLDKAYLGVKKALCQKLGEAWRAYQNASVREVASQARQEFEKGVDAELENLTDRESGIIRLRYGLGGNPQTMEEVGGHFGVRRERIRQVEAKAIRKLQQDPGTVKRIQALLEQY